MIHAQNIYKSFEGLEVLKGVSLSINKGEIVSIIELQGRKALYYKFWYTY